MCVQAEARRDKARQKKGRRTERVGDKEKKRVQDIAAAAQSAAQH